MTILFTEGFDKYGPPGTLGTANGNLQFLLQQEWTSIGITQYGGAYPVLSLIPSLSGLSGCALQIYAYQSGQTSASLYKALTGNCATLIGGMRFKGGFGGSELGVAFSDAGNAQCSICINSMGTVWIRNGSSGGGVLAGSTVAVSANSVNYLEWQVTFGTTAAYQVWLNGISIFSGTGNTKTTANSYANGFTVGMLNVANDTVAIDDIYLFDNTTAFNNAPVLTNPAIETQFASGDSSVAFTMGAGVLGQAYYTTLNTSAPSANVLVLCQFTPIVNCTLNSIGILPQAAVNTANFKAVVYATSGGIPTTLLGTGTQVTGATNVTFTLPFASGISLTAGTQYAIGYITDTSVNMLLVDSTTFTGKVAANTYTAGAPGTAPAMTGGQPSWMIWGNISGTSTSYTQENCDPALGLLSYNYSSTVAQSELFNFPALGPYSSAVYAVVVKSNVELSIPGARTISMELNSAGTLSAGSKGTISVPSSFSYVGSSYNTDPATGLAWTVAGVNAATSGITVVS
jgi:hypothetical protein